MYLDNCVFVQELIPEGDKASIVYWYRPIHITKINDNGDFGNYTLCRKSTVGMGIYEYDLDESKICKSCLSMYDAFYFKDHGVERASTDIGLIEL